MSQEIGRARESLEKAIDLLAVAGDREIESEEWYLIRARLGQLRTELELALNEVSRSIGQPAGQGRILEYLMIHRGEIIDKDQLRGVAGIDDWARRVRELRVEQGYRIVSGLSRDGLRPFEYMLEDLEPDYQLAEDWRTAKEIRNRAGSGRDRLLAYLKAVHPRSADKERLRYVARIQSHPRRLRELVEDGWRIMSSKADPDLPPGDYRLASLVQAEGRSREALKVRYEIIERDGFSCRECGRSPEADAIRLEVHHIDWVSRGGDDSDANLKTLCSACHAGTHSVPEGTTRDELESPGAELNY